MPKFLSRITDPIMRFFVVVFSKIKGLRKCLPGYPAFQLATLSQRKEALLKFGIALTFSLSPMMLIVFLDAISKDGGTLFQSALKYTEAGQIYFYIGPILGFAFILIRDNFREDYRERNKESLVGFERKMRSERTWFTTYIVVTCLASAIILCVYHLKADNGRLALYLSSIFIYLISLYVWFVDVLYAQIDLGQDDDNNSGQETTGRSNEKENGGAGRSPEVVALSNSLKGFNGAGTE